MVVGQGNQENTKENLDKETPSTIEAQNTSKFVPLRDRKVCPKCGSIDVGLASAVDHYIYHYDYVCYSCHHIW